MLDKITVSFNRNYPENQQYGWRGYEISIGDYNRMMAMIVEWAQLEITHNNIRQIHIYTDNNVWESGRRFIRWMHEKITESREDK